MILSFLSFLVFSAHAGSDFLKVGWQKGKCYPTYPVELSVIEKLDKDTYHLQGPKYNIVHEHAILKMSPGHLLRPGRVNILYQHLGEHLLPLANGFEEMADLLVECVHPVRCYEGLWENKCP